MRLVTVIGLALAAVVAPGCRAAEPEAAEPALIPTPPAEQMAILRELAARVAFTAYATDEAGNLVYVGFCHSKYARSELPNDQTIDHRDRFDELPNLRDEDFQRIRHFPHLRALSAQFVAVTDEGYAVLRSFPDLQAINLSNLKQGDAEGYDGEQTTSQVFRFLDGMRDLRYWNTTHSFGFNGEPAVLQELQGFPELRYLNVDVGHSDDFDELFPFIAHSPQIRHLKLHRCTFSDEQMRAILDALPELQRLDMKPRGNTPGERWSHRSLAMLQDYPNLHYLRLIHGDALPLPWADGLEHLVAATNITHIEFPLAGSGEVRAEDIRRLMVARPDLEFVNLPEELLPKGVSAREHHRRVRSEMGVATSEFPMAVGPQ